MQDFLNVGKNAQIQFMFHLFFAFWSFSTVVQKTEIATKKCVFVDSGWLQIGCVSVRLPVDPTAPNHLSWREKAVIGKYNYIPRPTIIGLLYLLDQLHAALHPRRRGTLRKTDFQQPVFQVSKNN